MVKRVRSDSGPLSLQKQNHVCVKLGVTIFLVGLAFRLLFWDSFSFSSVVETPPSLAEHKTESPVLSSSALQDSDSDDFPGNNNKTQISKNGKGIFLSYGELIVWMFALRHA